MGMRYTLQMISFPTNTIWFLRMHVLQILFNVDGYFLAVLYTVCNIYRIYSYILYTACTVFCSAYSQCEPPQQSVRLWLKEE